MKAACHTNTTTNVYLFGVFCAGGSEASLIVLGTSLSLELLEKAVGLSCSTVSLASAIN